jgi:hypothetical protein
MVDRETFDKVRELYLGMGGWSRNRSFHRFNDPVSATAARCARRLVLIREALRACNGSDGKVVVRRGDGRVAIRMDRGEIAAVWTACMSEPEYELILNGHEETPGCGVC